MSMIPGDGWEAVFTHENGNETTSPIIYFDENGDGWITPTDGRSFGLVNASCFHNLHGYYRCRRLIASLPAAGWTAIWEDGAPQPLVGWAVYDDGVVDPIYIFEGRAATEGWHEGICPASYEYNGMPAEPEMAR